MIYFDLPWPNPRLNPNQSKGKHWGSTATIRQKAKSDAFNLARAADVSRAFNGSLVDIPVTLTFCAPDNRRRDRDNLLAAMKPALDGVALALGVDDSQFEPVTLRRGQQMKGGKVMMTLDTFNRDLEKMP